MGLKADIDEVKASWSTSPWWVRIWLALSAYLAISSIASLAETIVKWKGFILDAVLFYREWINLPLKKLFLPLNIHLTNLDNDKLIIAGICFLSFSRALYCSDPVDPGKRKSVVCLFIPLNITLIILLAYYLNSRPSPTWSSLLIDILILLIFPIILVRRRKSYFGVIYYSQIAFCVCIIALLAAVNKGIYE